MRLARAAVFDLDGTLVPDTSAERLLVPWLVRRGVVGVPQLAAFGARLAWLPVKGSTAALRSNKRWLTGVRVERVVELAGEFVRAALAPRFCPFVLSELRRREANGARVWLLTGAPEFLARAVAEHLGLAGAVATELEVRAGRFTGEIAGRHVFAEEKREALAELAAAHALDLSSSAGFADHGSDVHFLECFGEAVAVRPDRRLLSIAGARGWAVLPRRRSGRLSASGG